MEYGPWFKWTELRFLLLGRRVLLRRRFRYLAACNDNFYDASADPVANPGWGGG